MKLILAYVAISLGLAMGTAQSLAGEPNRPTTIRPSDGPMPELLCADLTSVVGISSNLPGLHKLTCREKQAQPCAPSPGRSPLQSIIWRLRPAKIIGIRRKANGCYELIFTSLLK
jgi:hypothetical protein